LIPPSIQVWGIPESIPLGAPSATLLDVTKDGFDGVDIDFEDICDRPE
jgi:hypothetical protein